MRYRRSHLATAAMLSALAIILAAGVVLARQAMARVGGQPRYHLVGTEVFPTGLHRPPGFALRDETGRVMTLAELHGKILAITFLDSLCTKQCPIEGAELATAQRDLGPRSPLTIVVISVHPGADTPSTARAFMRKAGVSGTWHWLFGTHRRLSRVWFDYGIDVQPTTGDITHTNAVYLIDRDGWMRVADAVPLLPSQLVESVRALQS